MVNYSTNINKTNIHLSPKESLNSDGQQFYLYQQNKQSPPSLFKLSLDERWLFILLMLVELLTITV
jgi:uncharacterized membrane protein